MGADVVGGILHYEPAREFGEKSIHDIVKLALKYDKLIDVHCDETDDPNSRFVEILNALVLMEDFGTKTTIHVRLVQQTIPTLIECWIYSKKVR